MRKGSDILVIVTVVIIVAVPVGQSCTPIIGEHHLLLFEEGKQIPAVGILQYQVEAVVVVKISLTAQNVGMVQPGLDLDLPPSDGDALLGLQDLLLGDGLDGQHRPTVAPAAATAGIRITTTIITASDQSHLPKITIAKHLGREGKVPPGPNRPIPVGEGPAVAKPLVAAPSVGVLADRIGPEPMVVGLIRRGGGDGPYRRCYGHGGSSVAGVVAIAIMIILASTFLGQTEDGAFGPTANATIAAAAAPIATAIAAISKR